MDLKYFFKKTLCSLLLLAISQLTQAQKNCLTKAEECLGKEKFKKGLKLLEGCKKDKEFARNPETYLLESKILLAQSKLEHLPEMAKDAVKAAVKASEKAENSAGFIEDNQSYYNEIAEINNKEAMQYFNEARYSKAIVLFKRSADLGINEDATYMLGKSYALNNDANAAIRYLVPLINQKYNGNETTAYLADAYNICIDQLVKKGYNDSADYFLAIGLNQYPKDKEMLDKQKVQWYKKMTEIPLSDFLFNFLEVATKTYPFDSAFTFKKNGVYLMFINNNIKNNQKGLADSWLNKFVNEKRSLHLQNPSAKKLKEDYFLAADKITILEKLVFYYGNYEQKDAMNYIFRTYVEEKFQKQHVDKAMLHLEGIFPSAIVAILYAEAIAQATNKPQLILQRKTWFNTLMSKTDKKINDYEALIEISSQMGTSNSAETKKILVSYWTYALQLGDFWKVYEIANLAEKAKVEGLAELWRMTIRADFDNSYFKARVLMNTPASQPYGFSWNGDKSACYPGELPDSIVRKVNQRINYFRRLAGITDPLGLMQNYNTYCQKAVMYYEANNNLTHDLNQDMYCYTEDGALAGKNGLLTQNVHTTIAITEFMNDNTEAVGNRRWLLYPPTKFMGFGCSDKYSVLWCVNASLAWDTAAYIDNGIAWPPAGYSPRMFAFQYWSYSAFQNFEGAKVEMVNLKDNSKVACKVNTAENGYGMPTIVWEPSTLIRAGQGDADYQVNIKWANGKKVTYTIHLVDVR